MKIGYIGEGAYRTVMEHCKSITLGINEDTEACLVESAQMEGPSDLPCLNTCQGVRTLSNMPELATLFSQQHGLVDAYPTTYLYGFISPDGWSDMIEMTYSTRMLTGDIGVQVDFVQGTGLAVVDDLALAIPQTEGLKQSLVELEYRGEIKLGLTKDYKICSVEFGHSTAGFALYTELLSRNPQEMYEWCLGIGEKPRLFEDGVAVVTMLSYPPFPYDTSVGLSVKAPRGAEKHLYRVAYGKTEVAYASTWGKDIFEAKRRCRKTIDNCRAYNKDIQYRIDYGCGDFFVLSQERYEKMGGNPPRASRSSTSR